MANRTDELLKLPGADAVVDQIKEIYGEAAEVYEQALIAMGQRPATTTSPVASTEVEMNLTPDLSSKGDHG